jgi:SAM-dependent methyltransferase
MPRLSIAIISASALAYEVLLTKLFSIILWHHFAYMIISLALLGYGVSGTFLALARERLLRNFSTAYIGNIILFSLSSLLCFMLAQQLPFNPLLLEVKQLLWLMCLYLLLALPFFFAANAVGLAIMYYKKEIAGIYAADLLGAGLGSLAILGLLYLLFPAFILESISLAALLGALVAFKELSIKISMRAGLLFALSLLTLMLSSGGLTLKLNEYKALSQTLRISGTKIVAERSSPLTLLTVVESPDLPFRYAPGLSIASDTEPPPQLGVFTNGDGISAITEYPKKLERLHYLDEQSSALAYHLGRPQQVLVLGAGGGAEVLQALYQNTKEIDAIEIDPEMVDLVKTEYAAFAGHLYDRENVTVHTAEARAFLASTQKRYDLIQMAMVDAFGASSAGLHSLNEDHLYTIEALQLYLRHLKPGGYLSLTRWLKLPPRDTFKLFATALEALERSGVLDPQKQLVLIRGWQTTTLVIKNGPLSDGEIGKMKRFCDDRFFDTAYYNGLAVSETNRYNILKRPYFFEGVRALLDNREQYYRDYKFDIRPATDDHPYFYHFFKWKTLGEILSLRGSGGLQLLEWGYLLLVAALLQALIASTVLILLPLLRYRRSNENAIAVKKSRVLLYFSMLGLGFLFIEIYFMQRFILFLNHPIYSLTIILSAFLVFAGLGSGYGRRLAEKKGFRTTALYGINAILTLGLLYVLALEPLFDVLLAQAESVKMILSIVLIAPLAFAMGLPFAMGLSELGRHSEPLIPWAWGVNGCASVISAVAATLVAVHFGFTIVMAAALLFYLIAAISFPQRSS